MGGHNRKTVAQHQRDGTYRADRHGQRQRSATARKPKKPPTPPKELEGEALELWKVLVKQLDGVVGPTDGPSLALLCVTWANLMKSALKLAQLDPGSEEHARLSRAMRSAHETYAKLAEKFGLTPVDRERLPVGSTGEIGGVVYWS